MTGSTGRQQVARRRWRSWRQVAPYVRDASGMGRVLRGRHAAVASEFEIPSSNDDDPPQFPDIFHGRAVAARSSYRNPEDCVALCAALLRIALLPGFATAFSDPSDDVIVPPFSFRSLGGMLNPSVSMSDAWT